MNKKQGRPDPSVPFQWDAETLEAATEAAIRACDGNTRAAVRALVLANAVLEAELERAVARLSSGYVRGKLRVVKMSELGSGEGEQE